MRQIYIQSLELNGTTYEQRYVLCGKKNCWCARRATRDPDAQPGHGPYWYKIIWKVTKGADNGNPPEKVKIAVYVGKELRTS